MNLTINGKTQMVTRIDRGVLMEAHAAADQIGEHLSTTQRWAIDALIANPELTTAVLRLIRVGDDNRHIQLETKIREIE